MSEFKGTKGKWEVGQFDKTFIYNLGKEGINTFEAKVLMREGIQPLKNWKQMLN